MKRVWLIYNRASGSVADTMLADIDSALDLAGAVVVGRTPFPEEAMPEPALLDDVDTVVVAAGDGTINAAARVLADWPGRLLVLPGGTMNMLPKLLHGASDSIDILAKTPTAASQPLPTVESPGAHAFVGALVGPAAIWVHAREAIRKGRWHRLRRAVGLAWTRSFAQSVRIVEDGRRSRGYRAIFVTPEEGRLRLITVEARGWRDGAGIGWHWLRGDVTAAPGVTGRLVDSVTLAQGRPVFALFDGEPSHLPVGSVLRPGQSRLQFVNTL